MSIIQRYILRQFIRNLAFCSLAFISLFLVFDFLDRIDNILPENPSLAMVFQYFIFKVPLIFTQTLPIAVLLAVIFTVGLLSKNSEFTAMRAAGLTILHITKPLYLVGFLLSLGSIIINETLVPYATRRVREIYNLDIRQKHQSGDYNQSEFWWRSGRSFYSASMFDSRTNTLHDLLQFDFRADFSPERRLHADKATYVAKGLGWTMHSAEEFLFDDDKISPPKRYGSLPLPITKEPRDFYDVETDPDTMSYRKLRRYIKQQNENGVSTTGYLADLYDKLAFPFISLIIIPATLTFAIKPARSGSLAASFVIGMGLGFSYYAVHSLSLAFGRAELIDPLLGAWMANIVIGLVGVVLTLGAESP